MSEPNDRTELAPGLFLELLPDRLRLTLGSEAVEFSRDEGLGIARGLVEAAAAGGAPPEEEHWHRVTMQYLILAVEPDPGADADQPPPVEVHCWIKEQTQRNAIHVAAGNIVEDGLVITDLVEQRPVTRVDFEGTELVGYYDQALIDDEVFLYVTGGDESAEG